MDASGNFAGAGPHEEVMREIRVKSFYLLILLFTAGLVFTWMSASKPISDFGNYYYGAKIGFDRSIVGSHQVYNVMSFNSQVEKAGETNFFLNHCTVTPQSVLLYRPFAWIPNAHTAKIVFNLFALLIFVFSLGRILKKYGEHTDVKYAMIAVAALIPIYYNILFGQTYLLITALIIETFLQADKRPWLSGIFLAIAISLKISPAIFLIWFLTERKFKMVGWTFASGLLIAVCTFLFIPAMELPFLEYYFTSFPRIMNGYITDPYSSSFQGFVVFLRKVFVPDAILNPDALVNGSERIVYMLNSVFFVIMSFLLVGAWKAGADWKKKILLLILLVNITSGYTSTYSLLLMLPFVSVGKTQQDWIRVMLYAAILMFPPRIFDGNSPFVEEYKLWMFMAIFIMEIKAHFSFRRLDKVQLAVGVIFLSMIIAKFMQRPEQLPLTYYKPEIVKQDYILKAVHTDSAVSYVAYTQAGFQEFSVPYDGERDACESCFHQYIHGVRLINVGAKGDSLLVLSDYHRGPGLFHLYAISKRDVDRLSQ